MQQEKKDLHSVWGRKSPSDSEEKNIGSKWPEFWLLVVNELQNQAVVSWQVDTIIYSSVQGHFTDWQIRQCARMEDGWQQGLGSVVQQLRLSLLSVVSEQHPIKSQHGHCGFSKREKREKNMGTKREQEEEVGKGQRRGDELSFAWEEGRAQGYDWLQAGAEFKANAQAPALCNGGRKGMWGTERGCKQERQVLVKKSKKRNGEEKKCSERILVENGQVCAVVCFYAINHKTCQSAQNTVFLFTIWLTYKFKQVLCLLKWFNYNQIVSTTKQKNLIFLIISYSSTLKTIREDL